MLLHERCEPLARRHSEAVLHVSSSSLHMHPARLGTSLHGNAPQSKCRYERMREMYLEGLSSCESSAPFRFESGNWRIVAHRGPGFRPQRWNNRRRTGCTRIGLRAHAGAPQRARSATPAASSRMPSVASVQVSNHPAAQLRKQH